LSHNKIIEDLIKKHPEISKLNSLELLALIYQLNKLTNTLFDRLLEKLTEEAKTLKQK